MDSSVTPIDNRPRLIRSDVNYTQVVVDRTWALDGTPYDVMFVGTGGSHPRVRTPAEPAHPCCGGPAPPHGAHSALRKSLGLAPEVCDPQVLAPVWGFRRGRLRLAQRESKCCPWGQLNLSRHAGRARSGTGLVARPSSSWRAPRSALEAFQHALSQVGGSCPQPPRAPQGMAPQRPVEPGSHLCSHPPAPSRRTDVHWNQRWFFRKPGADPGHARPRRVSYWFSLSHFRSAESTGFYVSHRGRELRLRTGAVVLHGRWQGRLCPALPGTSLPSSFALADRGTLHKAVSLENEAHIIEETRLFQDLEPVQTLLLNSQQVEWPGGQPHVSVSPARPGRHAPVWSRGPDLQALTLGPGNPGLWDEWKAN